MVCYAPGTRTRPCGLEYLLFVAQSMQFGMPDVCSAKREQVEHGIKNREVHNGNKVQDGFFIKKYGSLLRVEVDWVKAWLGGMWRLEVLGQS